jgi:hypothetical protein
MEKLGGLGGNMVNARRARAVIGTMIHVELLIQRITLKNDLRGGLGPILMVGSVFDT